jgi:hypothetical protein
VDAREGAAGESTSKSISQEFSQTLQCFADLIVRLTANAKFKDLPLARRRRGVSVDRRWQYRRQMTVLYSLFALRKDSGRPGLRHILSARNECIIKRERIKCG